MKARLESIISNDFMKIDLKVIMINISNASDERTIKVFQSVIAAIFTNRFVLNVLYINCINGSVVKQKYDYVDGTQRFVEIVDNVFPMLKMGRLHKAKIFVTQFDTMPYTFVENQTIRGIEGQVIDTICQKLNFPYVVVNSQSKNFAMSEFERFMTYSDLSLYTKVFLQKDRSRTHIQLNAFNGTCLLVPRNIHVTSYENLSLPFDSTVTVVFVIAVILTTIVWKLITMQKRSKLSLPLIIFEMYKLIIGQGFDNENRMSRKEKLLIYSFIVGNMLMVQLYQSWVTAFMLSESSFRAVQTINELNNSETKIYQYYREIDIKFRSDLIVETKSAKDSLTLTMPETFSKDLAYTVSCQYAEFFVNSKANHEGRTRLFEKLSEPISIMPTFYIANLMFPLKEQVKFVVDALHESGIKNHWIQVMTDEKVGETLADEQQEVAKFALNVRDMEFPFIILGSGCFVGFICLILEKLIYKFFEYEGCKVIVLIPPLKPEKPKPMPNSQNRRRRVAVVDSDEIFQFESFTFPQGD